MQTLRKASFRVEIFFRKLCFIVCMCAGSQGFWLVFGVQPYLLSTNAKWQKWPAWPKTPRLCHSWFSFFIFKVVHLCLTVLPSTLHISKCLSLLFASCVASVLPAYPCASISVSPCQACVCMLGFDFWTYWLCLLDWLLGLAEATFPLIYAVYPTETYSSLQTQMSATGRYTLFNSLLCEELRQHPLNSLLQSNSWCSSVPLLGNVLHYSHYSPKEYRTE